MKKLVWLWLLVPIFAVAQLARGLTTGIDPRNTGGFSSVFTSLVASGSNAINLLDGARLNFSTGDASAYLYRSAANTIRTPGSVTADATFIGNAQPKQVTLTFANGAVAVDASAGGEFILTENDATSTPAISSPTGPQSRQRLLFKILCTSGTTCIAPTWSADFHMAGSAPSAPATGKLIYIQFEHNGSGVYYEMFRSAADITQ